MSKKSAKSLEEFLKEALVPEEEQPYKVPENWAWVKLASCLENLDYGYTASSTTVEVGPHYLRITDIQNNNVDWHGVPFCEISEKEALKYQLTSGDIVVARTGATTGKSYLIKQPPQSVFASYLIRLRTRPVIIPEFLWSYMKSPMYWNQITVVKKGSAQPGANAQILGGLALPLPPLDEQKRIADKVERLLDKINQAKQLIEEAKATFELRRAAILDKAFRGELTKKWREEHIERTAKLTRISSKLKPLTEEEFPFEIPDSWSWYKLGEILKITSGGTPSRSNPEYYEGDIPWIKTGEIKWNDLIDTEEKISEDAIKNSSAKLLPINTVLVAMYGQGLTRGRAAILRKISACNQAVCALLPNENIDPKFLFYFFMEGYHRFRKIAQGGNQENLSDARLNSRHRLH